MKFSEIVNIGDLKRLCEDFTLMSGTVTAILDLDGNVLIATGWQNICTQFHRVHPITAARCRESDTVLAGKLQEGEGVNIYKCKNGLVDVAVPIKIRGVHVANFFTGQFFLEPPDKEFFIQQAEEFGFDKDAYLEALSKVPILSPDTVTSTMRFFAHLGQLFGEMGLARKELEEANTVIRLESARFSESEERFRSLVNTIPDLIWLKDAQGVYLSCNQTFERFFGAKEADIVGKTDYDFVAKDIAVSFREHDLKAMAAGKPSSNEEWITFADDGCRALIYTTKVPMHAADGTLIGVLGIGREITDLRRAENERAALENQLHQTQKIESIGQLAGGIAHDFNNMLGVIIGHAELAQIKSERSRSVDSDLEEILKAARHSADLTKQLLTFARKQAIAPEVLDLNKAIAALLKMLQRLIGENIHLSWHPVTGLWPVKIDNSQLDQVLANLCLNARDAISGTGTISIKTTTLTIDKNNAPSHLNILPGDYVMLSVSDDGCGMEKETLKHIFEPFFTKKEIGKGTGLGLATVYGAVKQNNGIIDVLSQPGAYSAESGPPIPL